MSFETIVRLMLWMATLSLLFSPAARAEEPATKPASADKAKIRIVLAGDSTVAEEHGWGNGFTACVSDQVQVTNLARNGRSTKSFVNEGSWKKCIDLKPDYILIQFGHNDQKLQDPARGTDPQTTYRQYLVGFIDEARAAGIKPVLVTSLSRRRWGADGKTHSDLFPYVDVVKDIAAKMNVPLIDLHARSIELYDRLGKAAVDELSPSQASTLPAADPAQPAKMVVDNTHLNAKGGEVIGKIVAEELAKAVPDLAQYINVK